MQLLIVIAIVVAAAAYLAWRFWPGKGAGAGCGCSDCGGCAGKPAKRIDLPKAGECSDCECTETTAWDGKAPLHSVREEEDPKPH
jgi:hypothetical protein